ncbi:MAG: DegV family protein [Clostridia bacterium]|nr:DegV family protein [Clostridia bacterium]
MNYKIVSDSSSNILTLDGVSYASVPLKINTSAKEYVDDSSLDVAAMVADLRTVKGRTGTSCPNVQEWQDAMRGADGVFAVTITSGLSGSYSTAVQAKNDLIADLPEKKIAVIDSLSAGPELQLLIERMREDILAGKTFEEIETEVRDYQKRTHLIFALESMTNLARNGRVNPVVAKLAGVLGIRVVGVASEKGTLEVLHKPRGRDKMLNTIYDVMKDKKYAGGKVRIAHCLNPEAAKDLESMIRAQFPDADIELLPTTALCSFYAEEGGLMIGFESAAQ